ncbi:MAG: hypothetical protein JWP13_10, partial [Candidatus Saccharibacteria bacterium]|nr:hypothetical protein [Candidatus Saccharibacteria bacterium]
AAPNSGAITPPGAPAEAAATQEDPEMDCDMTWNPLTWFLCPLVKLLNSTINGLDNAITGLLTVEQDKIFNTASDPGRGYYKAWQTFRGIALGLLVIGALIMIISQALGFDFLDAYTIKKVVPRLLVAIIGIALSWEIMRWFVILTNNLGMGVRSLIYYPFVEAGMGNLGDTALAGGAIIPLLLTGGFLGLGLMGLLSFGATALLALFIAFMVLILRQLVIVVLILFAPIAIAAYILPNTQGIWKLWYESFTKALMMFPIIMAFLAVGRVYAMTSGGEGATVDGQIIAFVAYIIPYFLIPLTFRFAGGALSTLGGFVNNRGRGAFDRLKKYRGNQMATNMQAMKENRRFNPNANGRLGKINRKLNSGLSNITSPGEATKVAVGNRLRKKGVNTSIGMGVMDQVNQGKFEHSKKAAEMLMNMPMNDRALRGLMGMQEPSAANIRKLGTDLLASDDSNDRIAGNMLLSSATQLSTDLYKNPEMGRADIRAAAGMALSQHGFAEPDDIAQLGNRLGADTPGGAVRNGFAQSVVNQAQLNSMRAGRSDFKPGYSIRLNESGGFDSLSMASQPNLGRKGKAEEKVDPVLYMRSLGAQIERIKGMNAQDWTAGKAQTIDSLATGAKTILSTPDGQSIKYRDESDKEVTLTITKEIKDRLMTQYASALGPYSGGSIDHTTKIQEILKGAGMTSEMEQRLQAFSRGEAGQYDPNAAQLQKPPEPKP